MQMKNRKINLIKQICDAWNKAARAHDFKALERVQRIMARVRANPYIDEHQIQRALRDAQQT
jgi:hypothetical protein